jgi:hypothetical protein
MYYVEIYGLYVLIYDNNLHIRTISSCMFRQALEDERKRTSSSRGQAW